MTEKHTHIVKPTEAHRRLDQTLLTMAPSLSRAHLQKLVKAGQALVNGKRAKPGHLIKTGDTITLTIPRVEPLTIKPTDIPLDILYEDQDILVVNKPAGLTVHPGAGTKGDTLVHALLHHVKDLSGIQGVRRPGIVHRLDKGTSGVMVIAKHDQAHLALSHQFKTRQVQKQYLALVTGMVKPTRGTIAYPIGRDPKDRKKMLAFKTNAPANIHTRAAETTYRVLKQFPHQALLVVEPKTGRTHQIRVHLKSIGYPIVGDPLYRGKKARTQDSYPALHAWKLSFTHPISGKLLTFTASPPSDVLRYF